MLTQLEEQARQNAIQQATNTQALAQLTEDVASLTDVVTNAIEIIESDREAFREEIRRIWEYLLKSNGHGGV
ncbi:type 2 periplasmic-binding domain-containing protein [Anabaena azotica]|uniref:Uncharacterized protein n=1 Tax=Anabaena azotica FACHB-119 TaxID=947527 RepID=A0ABR8DDE1_9NOST|nr:hypothetical protein [Anabaena azotica]MBD2505255.1 hypothetical protein [Anabaena azotica FACHB-119]